MEALMASTDWLKQRAAISPQKLALTFGERRWRYAALDTETDEMAGRLAAAGLHVGSRAAALLPNRPEAIFVIHAAARLGVQLVFLNLRLTPVELRTLCRQAGAEMLFCFDETAGLAVESVGKEFPIFTIDETEGTYCESLPASASFTPQSLALERVQSVIPTSGTTGESKLVPLRFENLLWSATASAYRLGHLPGDRWLASLPLYHVGGMSIVFRSCLYGSAITLVPGFDAGQIVQEIQANSIRVISLVPTMLKRLLDEPGGAEALRSLRIVLIGGAAVVPELLERSLDQGLPIALTYGLTEAASQVATAAPDQVRRKPGTVGRSLMFSELRILDEDGQALLDGQVGEVVVRGLNVTLTDEDGWLHTGDLGRLDEDGDLWLRGRLDDLILSGAEKIYPYEIEATLEEHEWVEEACVVGLDDEEWGQRVVAAVLLTDGIEVEDATLLDFAQSRLAGFKRPHQIFVLESFPRTASGKLRRSEVRGLVVEAQRPAALVSADGG